VTASQGNDEGEPPPAVPGANIVSIASIEGPSPFGDDEHVAVHIALGGDESVAPQLSPREREIALLLAQGYSHVNVGAICGLSPHTVRTYIRRTYVKLAICNRADLVRALYGSERAAGGASLNDRPARVAEAGRGAAR
jgi:DNA-binding CsgD family transcriptional regulator